MTTGVVVRVPATSANVGPGFDAFGMAIARHLVVAVEDATTGTDRVATDGLGAEELPSGDDNLIWRSFVAFCDHVGTAVPPVHLRVRNDIPVERGLGSSSSAIVAGLVAARAVTGVVFGDLDLVALATTMEGHPDNVAPAILGGFVACAVDDNGGLVVRRINPTVSSAVVLVPSSRQRTDESRDGLPAHVGRDALVAQAARAGHVLGAIGGLWPVAPAAAGDRYHEPVRLPRLGPMAALLDALRASGAHAWLSGSGPSVVALAHTVDPSVAEAAADADVDVVTVPIDLAGALTCPPSGCAVAGGGTCVQCPRDSV
ncbi:MAG: homoserine kinase [Nitriliruptoraceae bacterium]